MFLKERDWTIHVKKQGHDNKVGHRWFCQLGPLCQVAERKDTAARGRYFTVPPFQPPDPSGSFLDTGGTDTPLPLPLVLLAARMKIRALPGSCYNVGSTMLVPLLLLWISQLKECARGQNQVPSMLQLYYVDVFPGWPHTSASLLFVFPPLFKHHCTVWQPQTTQAHRQLGTEETEWKADEGSSRMTRSR